MVALDWCWMDSAGIRRSVRICANTNPHTVADAYSNADAYSDADTNPDAESNSNSDAV